MSSHEALIYVRPSNSRRRSPPCPCNGSGRNPCTRIAGMSKNGWRRSLREMFSPGFPRRSAAKPVAQSKVLLSSSTSLAKGPVDQARSISRVEIVAVPPTPHRPWTCSGNADSGWPDKRSQIPMAKSGSRPWPRPPCGSAPRGGPPRRRLPPRSAGCLASRVARAATARRARGRPDHDGRAARRT